MVKTVEIGSIEELQKGLLGREYSAAEIVDGYRERIRRIDSEINAFNTVTEEEAYKKAREIDRIIKVNRDKEILKEYPLLGVVVAHKDLFLTKGVRTTASSKVLSDYVAVYSATAVERMEKAGAIMIGKANCDAWAHGASGENSDFGATKNPWNTEYVAGGSSSGSAAAVSAGMAVVSTGTDTGGSIRLPASFSNLVGLKPTYGAVSRYGVVAMASSLDCVGHFTKTVVDSRNVFNVIRGEDGRDSNVANVRSKKKSSKIVMGVAREYFSEGIEREVRGKVEDAIDVYKSMGVEIREISLTHTEFGVAVYYIIQTAETSSNLSRYDGVRYGRERRQFGDEAKRRIMLGTYVLSAGYYDAYYLRAMKVRSKIVEDFEKAFKEVDAIIAPVSPTPPFKLGEKSKDPLRMYLSDIFTVSANLAGIPALAIPAGFTSGGLPVGFQLMGEKFSEEKLFELGDRYQKLTDWHLKGVRL